MTHDTNAHWLDKQYCIDFGFNEENIKEIQYFLDTHENIVNVNIYAYVMESIDLAVGWINQVKTSIEWCNNNCEEKFFCAGYPEITDGINLTYRYSAVTLFLFTSQKDAAKFLVFGT